MYVQYMLRCRQLSWRVFRALDVEMFWSVTVCLAFRAGCGGISCGPFLSSAEAVTFF